ncbi:flavin reductase family protein [Thauera sinica]|uniref:Flavin reductase family protein n=1 Tax=Thauera sinica TaxID=2665146 RepID=A0ABW1AXF2_9RHOO|nr:flavin reductase family protein [Thauera sp. K11]ATE58646.1 hypothetical protein CCZ27_00520 [Thauera sp. K11]
MSLALNSECVATTANERAVDSAAFRQGMRLMAGAVCIVATGRPGRRAGLTATAVCSVSSEPPRLLACINKSAAAHGAIHLEGRLSVNVLSGAQQAVASRFSTPLFQGEAKFAEGDWKEAHGVPVLGAACAAFVCSVAERVDAGSHTIFICDVLGCSAALSPPENEGLLYFDGRYRHLAPSLPPAEA